MTQGTERPPKRSQSRSLTAWLACIALTVASATGLAYTAVDTWPQATSPADIASLAQAKNPSAEVLQSLPFL